MANSLESRIDFIRNQIREGEFTSPARESTVIIENSFRELYRRSIGLLHGADRVKVNQAEIQIGGGTKTLDDFTMGQLVALYRNSGFLKSWSTATGNELRGISMINLDEIVKLRNGLQHGNHEATRGEAELLFQCVQAILETFGILSLDAIATEVPALKIETPKTRSAKHTSSASKYAPDNARELDRLSTQAQNIEPFDRKTLAAAAARFGTRPLVVVDLGSANGTLTKSRFSSDQYARVLGIDRNPNLVAAANASLEEGSKFSFVQADLETDDIESVINDFLESENLPRVDLIFSALTLHHLANPIKLLRTCRYVLGETGTIVLRGSDDGSKLAWPDPDQNVERIIELTLASPGVSDRLNGRKIYSQLYRAGFRNIEIANVTSDTAGLRPHERSLLFLESFGYRANYLAQRVESSPSDASLMNDLEEMRRRLDELEVDFEDEGFYYVETHFGATARIS